MRAPAPLQLALPGPRRRYGGLVVSLLVHALLVVLVARAGERIWSRTLAPGDPALLPGGGGGGEGGRGSGPRVAYITLPPAPEPFVVRKAEPLPPVKPPADEATPTPTPPVPAPPPAVEHPVSAAQPSDTQPPAIAGAGAGAGRSGGTGGGTGGGAGQGIGPGRGAGAGPGEGGGGQGGRVRPPELRDLAFPFDNPPKELRGASLAVTFWVRVDGQVERYVVDPTISDRDYARKFDEVIRAFRFTPARAPDGTRIAGTTTVTFTLPGKRDS